MKKITLTGYDAIRYAERNCLTLCSYGDPTEDAREGLSVSEAEDIAHEDPSLIYLEVEAPEYDDLLGLSDGVYPSKNLNPPSGSDCKFIEVKDGMIRWCDADACSDMEFMSAADFCRENER